MKINQALLEFDFRNGPLRRKFDGIKYALKTIEDIAFELSLQQDQGDVEQGMFFQEEQQPSKKARIEPTTETITKTTPIEPSNEPTTPSSSSSFQEINREEFQAIQKRMAEYDQQREYIIKETRDIQKLAKQAIFAIVRGQISDGKQKLDKSKAIAVKLLPVIEKVRICYYYCLFSFVVLIEVMH